MKMRSSDFAEKVGLKGKNAEVTVYRWEHDFIKPAELIKDNILHLFITYQAEEVMKKLGRILLKAQDFVSTIHLISYPDAESYHYFGGPDRPPFWLYQQSEREIAKILPKIAIEVNRTEVTPKLYQAWLQEKGLEDSGDNKALFIHQTET